MSLVNSHTGFQPLEEVWLGDVYPDSYYDNLDPELRDVVLKISDITRQDLAKIQQTIESFGVKVCRPVFNSVDDFVDASGNLIKPPITPRDWALALGDHLYVLPQYESQHEPFREHIQRYGKQATVLNRFAEDTKDQEDWCYMSFPSIVRVGKDIFIDYYDKERTYRVANNLVSNGYRVHLSTTRDHSDAVFAVLKPEQILATHYRQHYNVGFPDWNVIHLKDTTSFNEYNGKWWVDGVDLQHFNNMMTSKFNSWLGNPAETVFEVNCLVIDESNVLVIAQDDEVCRQLEEIGITPHVVDFKARGFWDGGLHCLTLDIRRTGKCEDYWPHRGPPAIDYDTEYV